MTAVAAAAADAEALALTAADAGAIEAGPRGRVREKLDVSRATEGVDGQETLDAELRRRRRRRSLAFFTWNSLCSGVGSWERKMRAAEKD